MEEESKEKDESKVEAKEELLVEAKDDLVEAKEEDLVQAKEESKYKEWYDLRPKLHLKEEIAKDCHDLFGHPVVVITIFVVGMLVLLWGLWNIMQYMTGKTTSLTYLWWQSTIVFFFITVMGIVIPYRFRFGATLYGVITVLLIVEYIVLFLAFPVPNPSKEEMLAIKSVSEYLKKNPNALNGNH
jgi:hypothetical protein